MRRLTLSIAFLHFLLVGPAWGQAPQPLTELDRKGLADSLQSLEKTLAAAGIKGFSNILHVYPDRAPLRRNVETSEVAEAAAFLLSDAGKGITGEVLIVDAGYHVTGM